MKKRILPLILMILPRVAWAATPEELLRTAWKDPALAAHQQAVEISNDSKSLNPVEKTELRVERGQIHEGDLKYGLRVYPKGYSEHVQSSRFQQALVDNSKIAQQEAMSKALASRYGLLNRLALLKEKKGLSEELAELSRRANRALSYAAQRDRNELKSFLKAKTDLGKIDLKVADIERDFRNLQEELKDLGLVTSEEFNLSDLSGMSQIRKNLENGSLSNGKIPLSAKVAELDLERSRAGFEYEKARDDKWLDHFEVSMKQDKDDRIYGLQVAFNLPFAGAPDLGRIDKMTRELRDKAKVLETRKTADRGFQSTTTELKTLLDLHKAMLETQSQMNTAQMKKASQTIASQDPLLSIELQRNWFESREQLLDLEFRIRNLYVSFLHEASEIAENPTINFLSKSNKRIQ